MTDPADLLDLHLAALFTQDEQGNLIATNDSEPDRVAAPRLYLGRSPERTVLRFRSGMDAAIRAALREIAAPDLTPNDPNREPVNQAAMVELLAAEQSVENVYFGPAFSFPDSETGAHLGRRSGPVPSPSMGEGDGEGDPGPGSGRSTSHANVSESEERSPGLLRHSGESRNPDPSTAGVIEVSWLADELKVRSPIMAIVVDGMAVSVCFGARSTSDASEAGVETLPEHRGRRYAGAVTAAWADAVRRQGRIPLYSTSWTNHASRRVAARLALTQYATDFHIT